VVGRDSVIGIATRHGLDGPKIESRGGGGGRNFLHPSRPVLGTTQPTFQEIQGPGRGADPSLLAPRLKEE